MIFLDTSVLVDFLRGLVTPAAARLERLEMEGIPYAVPGFCCQEVLQGAKDQREWDRLREYLQSQRIAHPRSAWRTHAEAARIYVDLRRRGITVRGSVDCWIAQLALEAGAILLHDDDDFERIKQVRPLKTLRE